MATAETPIPQVQARPRLRARLRHQLRHRIGGWGLAGAAAALLALLLQLGWNRPRADQADALQQALDSRRAVGAATAASAPAAGSAGLAAAPAGDPAPGTDAADAAARALWARLPPHARLADDVLAVVQSVQAARLALERLDLRRLDAPAVLPQDALQLRLVGSYRRLRMLMQDLQTRLPHAALDDLALERRVDVPTAADAGTDPGASNAGVAAPAAVQTAAEADAVRAQLTLRLHYREPAR